MDIARIQREFADAQRTFALVELRPTTDGKVYARTALADLERPELRPLDQISRQLPERDAARLHRCADDHPRAAPVSGRAHLLPASVDVESRRRTT